MKALRTGAAVAVLFTLFVACGTAAPPTRPNDREWISLTSQYHDIETIRKQAPPWETKSTRKEQIEVLLETYRKLDPIYQPFLDRLKEYAERTGDERAIRLYSDEKIRIGDEYMSVLARYDNALGAYQNALSIDPTNVVAQQRMLEAQSKRFVTMDHFAAVKEGMSEDQVRRILGQPREDWIKQVVQKNRVYSVWIYPKTDGGASAVYFDAGIVYHTNWNAAPSKGEAK